MTKKRITAYWLLLVAMILLAGVMLAVGQTEARYANMVIWNTLISPDAQPLTLDDGQIADLGRLPIGESVVYFSLDTQDVDPAQLRYTFSEDVDHLAAVFTKESGMYAMTLYLQSRPSHISQVQMYVYQEDTLLGTFQMTLSEGPAPGGAAPQTMSVTAPEQTTAETYLKIDLSLPEGADSLELTMGESGFPAFTRYSADYGQTWNVLCFGGAIWVDAAADSLLLDVSGAENKPDGAVSITARAYAGQTLVAQGSADIIFEKILLQTSPLLTDKEDALVLSLPQGMEECDLAYTVLAQLVDTTGKAHYVDVTDNVGLVFAMKDGQLTVRFGQTLPPAGTYQLQIQCNYLGVCIRQTQVTFFINYSEANSSGGAA